MALRPRFSPGVPLLLRSKWSTLGFGTAPVKNDRGADPIFNSRIAETRVVVEKHD